MLLPVTIMSNLIIVDGRVEVCKQYVLFSVFGGGRFQKPLPKQRLERLRFLDFCFFFGVLCLSLTNCRAGTSL